MKRIIVATIASLVFASSAAWACSFENDVPVTSLSNSFDAFKVVTEAMAECGNFTAELDADYREKQPAAMAASPSQYTLAGVTNSTITPLLADGLIRPLNDLVEMYGQDLTPAQFIEIDGQIMSIAFMVNAQHLMYREDIMSDLGLDVPTTYAELLETAAAIQEAGVVDYPLGGTYASGWNLAEEFVNMYLGMGGDFFDAGGMPAIANEHGVATLEMMKALTEYMDPEYLASDSTYVQQQFQQGKIAMANLWASRAGAMDNEEESEVVGLVEFASAPLAREGGIPATTLWWDGFSIASNASDAEAEAAFKLVMEGITYDNLAANPDTAIWLSNGEIDSRVATGAVASAQGGAKSYPSGSAIGLMHGALGNNIADFLNGEESASAALADVIADYIVAATEAGILN